MTIFPSSIFWFIIHCDCLLTSCSFLCRSSFYITIPSKKATTAKQASLADFVGSNALKYSIIFNATTEQRAGAYTVIPCKHSKLLDWQFHIRRLRDSLSLITGDPVGIEEITNAVSSAVAIESSSIKQLPEDYCSNVFVVCVGYLLNNSSHLHAEARFFSLPAARVEPYGTNFALYSRSLPRAKAVGWIRDRVELSYKRDACGVQETLLYHTGGFVTEGLVSNVAVVSDRGELLCAEEDCLEGSMARIVRIAALRSGLRLEQGKGIPVPWAVGGSGWRAAILCNSARGVIPISHLQLPGKSECDGDDISSRIMRESGSLYGDGAVMYLNSGADLQVRSIQRLVNSFLNSYAEGDEGEGDEVLAMRQDFRKQYGYDPWTPLSDVIAIASNH